MWRHSAARRALDPSCQAVSQVIDHDRFAAEVFERLLKGPGKQGLIWAKKTSINSRYTDRPNTPCDRKPMTREQIATEILSIFRREFEIEHPGLDDDLRETYEFDSVDAIELLIGIERFLQSELTHDEKKMAMEIRTINQIVDYVERLVRVREREAHK
jgi:acyl carrier protein